MSKQIPFDIFEIRVYSDGYMLTVNKMRPVNAPHGRVTIADFKRKARVARENGKLADEGLKQPMQTLDQVVERIRSYGGVV